MDLDLSKEVEARIGQDLLREVLATTADLLDGNGSVTVCGKWNTGRSAWSALRAVRQQLASILDTSVYRGSGLRMLGSRKRGGWDVYMPTRAVGPAGEQHEPAPAAVLADLERWLERCSLNPAKPDARALLRNLA
ncbi:hypothetical protein OEZ85_012269 [Tetradesmus obliquus]|nr:hypothetical protein OEZ85_012269 [Tetradesmus obliquus]